MKYGDDFMLGRTIPIGVSWICRAVLWLVCGLTLLGYCQRMEFGRQERIAIPSDLSFAAGTLALAVWIGAILFCSGFFRRSVDVRGSSRSHAMIVPALIVGVLLPFPRLFPYVFLLVLLFILTPVFPDAFRLLRNRRQEQQAIDRAVMENVPAEGDDEQKGEQRDGEWIEESDELEDGNKTQQIVRFRTESGADRFEGLYYAEFRDDQNTASIHVPFCPMFDSMPQIEAYVLDDVDAKLTVIRPLPFGVRVDVKRSDDAPLRFPIMVVAEGIPSSPSPGLD